MDNPEPTAAVTRPQTRAEVVEKLCAVVQEVRQGNLDELLARVKARNIEHFVHFTRASNLPSILEHGLIPWLHPKAKSLPIPIQGTDFQRRDGLYEASCLSVTTPNSSMFDSKRKWESSGWAVLGFHAEAVIRKPTLFLQENAAKGMGIGLGERNFRNLASVSAFDSMFIGEKAVRIPWNLAPNQPTFIQSEVMVLDVIEPEALAFVALGEEMDIAQRQTLEASLPAGVSTVPVESEHHRSLFRGRPDVQRLRDALSK
ncbi:hypothetical protein LMG23992_00356 [Cupriavidus laharis]|uniref:DarT domain-containing protein n=1 Tax=Cupriavidus laharis TaxID=151654 RepID=A0ABM8WDN1_9BURK|nr:DarT ssDNA thymidine ADP-ribosyltransferase family protein [Cupriavidus laharis]CAG9165212.1 hypothetical protein LMG23992_00356 [Cupriavidus laharis]